MVRILVTIWMALATCPCFAGEGGGNADNYIKGPTSGAFFTQPQGVNAQSSADTTGSREPNATLLKQRLDQPGVAASKLDLPGAERVPVRDFVWSRDLKSAYLLSGNGEIRKFSLDKLTLEAFLDLQRTDATTLALSKEGLVLTLKELQEVWTIDEQTLRVVKKLTVPDVLVAYSAPSLTFAFALHGTKGPAKSIQVIDLKQNKITKEHSWYDLEKMVPLKAPANSLKGPLNWEYMQVVRTGEWIMLSGRGVINRFKIDGMNLSYVEQGKGESHNLPGFKLTSDGKFFIRLQVVSANIDSNDQWTLSSVSDLQSPRTIFPQKFQYNLVQYDPASGWYLAEKSGTQFSTFDSTGKMLRAYVLTDKDDAQVDTYVHPQGSRYFVITRKALLWVNLLPEGRSIQK